MKNTEALKRVIRGKKRRANMRTGKRVITACLLAMMLAALLVLPAAASGQAVHGITVNVVLAQDGSARISETWDITVDSGTEWYLVQSNLEGMEIRDFSVTDENGTVFQQEPSWDIDRSLEEKAGKCGIVTKNDGYELCWGVGSYGHHVFTASYTVTGLVKGFSDYNGFYHRFVNDELSAPPQKVEVWIEKENAQLTKEDTAVWAFGFEGEIWVEEGKIHATADKPLTSSGYVNILARFSPELFTPALTKAESFDNLKNQAMEGSDYQKEPEGGWGNNDYYGYENNSQSGKNALLSVLGMLLNPVIIVGVVIAVVASQKKKTRSTGKLTVGDKKVSPKDVPWNRDLPMEGDIPSVYALLKEGGLPPEDGGLIGAYLLRFLQHGQVSVEEKETKGFMGIGSSTETSVVLQHPPTEETEQRLYELMETAAGGDGILQEKEFYRWSRAHYTTVQEWQNSVERKGTQTLRAKGLLEVRSEPVFFGLFHVKREVLTASGEEQAAKAVGFKNYLQEFSLINERQPAEVALWDDYLVLATLFGIADRVAESFKQIYPRYFEDQQTEYRSNGDWMRMMFMVNHMSYAMSRGMQAGQSAAQQAMRSSGGGGHSSFSGGGGFSGGGHGGGSR